MGPNCPGLITRSFVGTDRFRCHSRTHSDTRSGHQRGHCRGASGRGPGETGVDPAQPRAWLALGTRRLHLTLVSHRPTSPPRPEPNLVATS